MPTKTFRPVRGKRIRVTRLTEDGQLLAPGTEDAQIVTSGYITTTFSAETEDGAEIIVKNANGDLCVNEKLSDSFKRFTVEMELCGVNPSLLAMMSNANTYEDWNGDVSGLVVSEGTIDEAFALEQWTGLSGGTRTPGAEEASGYMLLPFVNGGVLGDIAVESENAVTFSITGAYTRSGGGWGEGPYNVLMNEEGEPAPLPSPLDPFDHLLIIQTDVAPPPSADDPAPMPTVTP